ncbi:MAG: hypothetical protein MUF69_12205, partial [Desulfobacterota bacterium]|nr:hypothetical protein [Thermodesulfobacteriota bacterium]
MAAIFLIAVSFLTIGSPASAQEGCDFPLELGSGALSVQLSFDPKISCWAEGGSLADRYVDAQGSGSTNLTLSALFSGTLIPEDATLLSREITFEAASASSPNYQGANVVFFYEAGDGTSPATAAGRIDFSKIFNPDNGWAMFSVGYQIKVTDTYRDSEGTEHTTSQNFSSSFRLYAYRKVNVRVSTVPRGVGVGIQEIIREPNGAIVFRGIPGYWVDLTAAGQYIQFANSYPTTNDIGWAEFPFSIPLSSFPEGGQLSDTLIVDAGEEGIFTDIPVTACFAYITESRGEVFVKSGESWRPAVVGETLPKGTVLKFGGISPEPPYYSPRVVLRFGDGKEAVIETYTNHTRDLEFTLGDSYVQGQTGTVLMNGTIPMYDPNYSYWKWGKLALRGAISAGSWLTPLGWQARAGIIVVNLGMAAMDWWGPGANAGPDLLGAGPSLPPEYQTSSLLEVSTDLMGDGSLVLQNRGVAVKVETDNGQSAILPAGTQMTLSASSGLLSGVSALPRGTETGVAIQLTPPEGGSVTGATPELLIDYPDAWANPIIPESLTCRVNGVLVSPALTLGETASRYSVPPERQLRAGANILKAALTTQGGVRTRAESHFTAPDTAPAAPENVAAYAGRDKILLRWAPNREADLAGYRVYRAATPTEPGAELTAGLLVETIFVDQAPGGMGFYYVKALDTASQEGPESIRIDAALNPNAALVTPSEPTGFTAAAGDREVALSFDDATIPALGWRLLRSGNAGGPYSEIALIAR